MGKRTEKILLINEPARDGHLPSSLWPISGRPIVDNQLGQLPPQKIVVTGDCDTIFKAFLPLAYPQHCFEFVDIAEEEWDKYWVIKANQFAGKNINDFNEYQKLVIKDEFYIFSKGEEKTYLFQDLVIKYFEDPTRAKNRFRKAQSKLSLFPLCSLTGENLLSYEFVQGETLYHHLSPAVFDKFLAYCQEQLWEKVPLEKKKAEELCQIFYQEKTLKRVSEFKAKKCLPEGKLVVNGIEVPVVEEILNQIPWKELNTQDFYFIHGDLQFDNIIYNPKAGFTLIDWREDFGGFLEGGDLYYDLAKLAAGMSLPFDKIKQGKFSYHLEENRIQYQVEDHPQLDALRKRYAQFIKGQYSAKKVELLKGLIFLNMAPLHMAPLDGLFFGHGLLSLKKYLDS